MITHMTGEIVGSEQMRNYREIYFYSMPNYFL